MLISAYLGNDDLTDVGYQFFTAEENALGARVDGGITNAGDGYYTASISRPKLARSVQWDSTGTPLAAARAYFDIADPARLAPITEAEWTFKRLLNATVQSCGLNPETLGRDEGAAFASWLEARVEEAWIAYPWPGTILIEQRPLRAAWFTGFSYALEDVVSYEYPDGVFTYYQATSNFVPAGMAPDSEEGANYWEVLTPTDRYVELSQVGATPIGDVLGVWSQNPRAYAAPYALPWSLAASRIYLPTRGASLTPWVQYRKRLPRFTVEEYDADREYTIEDVLYLSVETGDCYVPAETVSGDSPVDLPELFFPQRVPVAIARFAQYAAKADWLSDNGQDEKATAAELKAERWMKDRMADLVITQGQAVNSYLVAA